MKKYFFTLNIVAFNNNKVIMTSSYDGGQNFLSDVFDDIKLHVNFFKDHVISEAKLHYKDISFVITRSVFLIDDTNYVKLLFNESKVDKVDLLYV